MARYGIRGQTERKRLLGMLRMGTLQRSHRSEIPSPEIATVAPRPWILPSRIRSADDICPPTSRPTGGCRRIPSGRTSLIPCLVHGRGQREAGPRSCVRATTLRSRTCQGGYRRRRVRGLRRCHSTNGESRTSPSMSLRLESQGKHWQIPRTQCALMLVQSVPLGELLGGLEDGRQSNRGPFHLKQSRGNTKSQLQKKCAGGSGAALRSISV